MHDFTLPHSNAYRQSKRIGSLFILWVLPVLSCSIFSARANDLDIAATKSQTAGHLRPFSVADSIGMTRLLDPEVQWSAFRALKFNLSPDGGHFVIVTRQGNLATGRNDYRLILYNTASILEFLNSDSGGESATTLPHGELLILFSTATNRDGIRQVRWLSDNRTLVLIGENKKQNIGQVFSVDIESKEVRQLTDHPRAVESFDVNLNSGMIAYTSTIAAYSEARHKTPYIVGTKYILDVMNSDREITFPLRYQYYSSHLDRNVPARALGEPFVQWGMHDIWLSPDGQWAIGLVATKNLPGAWAENYAPIANNARLKKLFTTEDDNTVSNHNILVFQFVLIDVRDETVRPIFDAPSGLFTAGNSLDVQWLPSGESVVLASTFLPLDVANNEERARRRRAPAVVEFNVRTQRVTRITDLAVPGQENDEWSERYVGMVMAPDGTLTIKRRSFTDPLPAKKYRKRRDCWIEISDASAEAMEHRQLNLSIRQDLNTPPDILVHDNNTGNERVITDLNPQFRQLTLGNVELIKWSDPKGWNWEGGLVYPPDFRRGERYPLVVQTHGFDHDEFLVDGPYGTASAYAAQAMANNGMLVLQLGEQQEGFGQSAELENIQRGIEALIDKLDDAALIDPKRIGLIGFSATGVQVQQLLLFSDYDYAAATIADGYSTSVFGYALLFGSPAPGMRGLERQLEAVPWGDSLPNWVARNSLLHLDLVRTPLRLEGYADGVFPWWDTYALLKRQDKPVEMLSIPDGVHQLLKPLERFASQQGNVDWFDFWLKDRERTEPYPGTPESRESLAEQYIRWRLLREQQEESEIEAIKARQWHRDEAARRQAADAWLGTEEGQAASAELLEAANDEQAIDKTVSQQTEQQNF